jgi:hypothetical protein
MAQTSFVSLQAAIATTAAIPGSATTPVAIYSTVLNSSKSQITVTGSNCTPSGLAPTIVFAHTQLALASFRSQKAVAQLPTALGASTYSLSDLIGVRFRSQRKRVGQFNCKSQGVNTNNVGIGFR